MKNSDNFPQNQRPDDDLIENASSFEEARAIIQSRLNYLRADINYHTTAEEALFTELCKAHEDKKHRLMDFYAKFYSPCKVSNPEFIASGQTDMNDLMINFSEGYDKFIDSMEKEYLSLTLRRRRATTLMSKMLSKKYPYCRIMYLYYYMNMDPKKISGSLFISRATFYRLKSLALNMLTSLYYPVGSGMKEITDNSVNNEE